MTGEWNVTWDGGLCWVVAALWLLLFVLAAAQHDLTYHTVRIYNWDGKRYRFLGRERVYKKNNACVVNMRERMGDMSFTTRYLLCPSRKFVKRNRHGSLLLRAGRTEKWTPVEERMRVDALYAYGQSRRAGRRIVLWRRRV